MREQYPRHETICCNDLGIKMIWGNLGNNLSLQGCQGDVEGEWKDVGVFPWPLEPISRTSRGKLCPKSNGKQWGQRRVMIC